MAVLFITLFAIGKKKTLYLVFEKTNIQVLKYFLYEFLCVFRIIYARYHCKYSTIYDLIDGKKVLKLTFVYAL